ncbi:NAD-glutamate dehydrogenase domain-containing protein [Sphingomonas crocodyli]|uniref:Glutamate dehydrogenase n=1 Tax=Sphingomonas crocodyli TaxID=1979270 RepID=A0A437M5G5_9SPHN|nr:NAD-glutamate dehydrogenase domain-containing protein [Sphingomonas crocodyli]RVT92961.1 glutamate dehydrogenase [Sphingomonas crocodyli]
MNAPNERPAPKTELLRAIDDQLTIGALPGELEQFDDQARRSAVAFAFAAALDRSASRPAVNLEVMPSAGSNRLMRLVIVNDDMPFLVDSVAALMADRGIAIHRLLHPIVAARRDEAGRLQHVEPARLAERHRESIIYMELDRVGARDRQALLEEIETVLSAVRAAVEAYPMLQEALRSSASTLAESEGAELLRWLLESRMTLLAFCQTDRMGAVDATIGLNVSDKPLLSAATYQLAVQWFEAGHSAPLLLKAERLSLVHRRAPFDLIIVPRTQGDAIIGLNVHAGLWASDALATRPDNVPVLRKQIDALAQEFGFDPFAHAGKALIHAMRRLPHDLLISFPAASLRAIALTAMSLIDRPRPKVVLIQETLGRHLFAFVWLARSDLTTSRREAIGQLIADEAHGHMITWTVDIGDGDLSLIRFTIALGKQGRLPATDIVEQRIRNMVRGWRPAVEAALSEYITAGRAAALAMDYADAFPPDYQTRSDAHDAAGDILAFADLGDDTDRAVRLLPTTGDLPDRLRLKIYRAGGLVRLSDIVPVLENFGFTVLEEVPTSLAGAKGNIHEFLIETPARCDEIILERAPIVEAAITAVLSGQAENDAFNNLIVRLGMAPRAIVLLRAWFRYLRQTGMPYGLATCAEALARAPMVTHGLIALFDARLDPRHYSRQHADAARATINDGLVAVHAIDDDRILRRMRDVIEAILRTNAFAATGNEALAFKLDSEKIPGLPAPRPWREVWVYSPRVEGIHLRGGPIARGGLRWSDRRDDFRTEVLGLLKAQIVKNAVIVPTGAKGGFYPKNLPAPDDRSAWIAEGTESYRVFIRALLSLTDNVVDGAIIHPQDIVRHDIDDPYFVVAADKGTATFSDIANAIAIEQGFWLGDAFASGGSNGYDHKAMGITARGAWVSVQRHFAEMGVDVQNDPVTVAGCGDMSGDVFGNGMLLSRSIRLIAAFDHRHIFIDPSPDPATSWTERERLFSLPTSSWESYNPSLISTGGGVYPRSQKAIALSPEAADALGLTAGTYDPATLIKAILKAPVDLLWFGGIGTYIKAVEEPHLAARDTANDANRVDARELRAKVIGEGANLSITQAGRIEFGLLGGRSNTDFIDNSAGVDCSDNEVNIKIALNAEVLSQRLTPDSRNALLAAMTDDVASLVLEDNRLQALALSVATLGGPDQTASHVAVICQLEEQHGLDRNVEGLSSDELFARRAKEGRGLTRPELAIVMSHAKLALQRAIEISPLASDPALSPLVSRAFPRAMQQIHADAITQHQLRREILATKIANLVVNRLGLVAPFELAEEEGVSLARVAGAYLACDLIFGLSDIFAAIEAEPVAETTRLELLDITARISRRHIANILRSAAHSALPGAMAAALSTGVERLDKHDLVDELPSNAAIDLRQRLDALSATNSIVQQIMRLDRLSEAAVIATVAQSRGWDVLDVERAHDRLGDVLGLSWAMAATSRLDQTDFWERLQARAIARDCQQLRTNFLMRSPPDTAPTDFDSWVEQHQAALERFQKLSLRIRAAVTVSPAMLAELVNQARTLLARERLSVRDNEDVRLGL